MRLLPTLSLAVLAGWVLACSEGSSAAASKVVPPAAEPPLDASLAAAAEAPVDAPLDELARELLAAAEAAMASRRPDAVQGLLKPVLDRPLVPSRVLFVAGWAAYQLLRYEDAVALMGRALDQDPGLLAESRVLAFGHHKLGDFSRAAELFRGITQVAPDEYRAWYGLGLAELSQGLYQLAQEHLERCLAARPEYLKARYAMGRLHEEQGHPEQALSHVTFVLESEPSHVEALYLLSRVQSALGQSAEAQATVARWRLAYTVREQLGPLQQLVVEGRATAAVFLEMADQYALLEDRGQQGRTLRDGLRRFPEHPGLRLALLAVERLRR